MTPATNAPTIGMKPTLGPAIDLVSAMCAPIVEFVVRALKIAWRTAGRQAVWLVVWLVRRLVP
jgi:hypothetical protein